VNESSESVKKCWGTVESTVLILRHSIAVHSLILPRALTFSSKEHGDFLTSLEYIREGCPKVFSFIFSLIA
jgi:hypothetical protein